VCGERCCKDVTLSSTNELLHKFVTGISINRDRQRRYKRNIEARSRNHCCLGKAINMTYSECVSSLRYPACRAHAPCVLLSSVTCVFVPHFSTVCHQRHHYRIKVIEHKMRVLTFCTTFVCNISYCKKNSASCRKCTLLFIESTHSYIRILM